MLRARDYAGPEDIPGLQRLVASLWAGARTPPPLHVGDVPWRLLSVPERRGEQALRLWDEAGEVVGFGWLAPPGELEQTVARGREDVLDAVLAWGETSAGAGLKVDALETQSELTARLRARGYRALPEDAPFVLHVRSLQELPEPSPAAGFALRHVRLPDDLARRVAVHRSAFGSPGRPSRVTEGSYAAVAAAAPYREGLDWVVEAPGGTFAASCLGWLDEENRVGLLEPVGTDGGHRRAGHAATACLGALRALAAAGAERAVVSGVTEPARALYRKLGFVEVGRFAWFTRP